MSPAVQRQLFEPFFTTKADIGAGLGLWVASGIVERHRGRLSVRSATDPQRSGSVFRLVLPCAEVEQQQRIADVEELDVDHQAMR